MVVPLGSLTGSFISEHLVQGSVCGVGDDGGPGKKRRAAATADIHDRIEELIRHLAQVFLCRGELRLLGLEWKNTKGRG